MQVEDALDKPLEKFMFIYILRYVFVLQRHGCRDVGFVAERQAAFELHLVCGFVEGLGFLILKHVKSHGLFLGFINFLLFFHAHLNFFFHICNLFQLIRDTAKDLCNMFGTKFQEARNVTDYQ